MPYQSVNHRKIMQERFHMSDNKLGARMSGFESRIGVTVLAEVQGTCVKDIEKQEWSKRAEERSDAIPQCRSQKLV